MGLLQDAKAIAMKDPAARNTFEVVLLYSGFHALVYHKLSGLFYRRGLKFIARAISQTGRFFTGIEIHPGAKLGSGLFIDHGMGVVIGETAVIGDNCTIYHQVTLGGTGKEKNAKRHPTVGNNVLIGAGAKLLGPFTVGDNALIGAGSVVLSDVPENATVVGIKARIVKCGGSKISPSDELNQCRLPDPIAQEICQLRVIVERQNEELEKLKSEIKTIIGRKEQQNEVI
ncbi:MAG: serine O-acetyltransferase [Clostridiales bacterium]|jgi:serine O-acetyltransferase|nr:serine O-acetyltransferase [Clostridiales bacterium]